MKVIWKTTKYILIYLYLFIISLVYASTIWTINKYGNISFDEIVFYLNNSLNGTNSDFINSFILQSILPSVVVAFLLLIGMIWIVYKLKGYNYFIDFTLWKKKKIIKVNGDILLGIVNIVILLITVEVFYFSIDKIGLVEYSKLQKLDSSFIEDNYVNPKEVEVTFPEQKRNLIYIYVESLESTHFSTDLGGSNENNLMPELAKLSEENITFSNTDQLGGALPVTGTTWTSGALIAQTAGLPLKTTNIPSVVEGAYSLGEFLEREGYNQMIMFGSDQEFGNRGPYFKTHGNYEVYDLQTARDKGKIPQDYYVWWGFEDSKLFEYAKEEIKNLAQKDAPFNFSLLTVNTHHIDGYLEESCETSYDNQVQNVVACTSKQLDEFIKWIQKQDFYENTTIVLSGDHLSMEPEYFNYLDSDYQRTIYNLFINSVAYTDNTKNRLFSTMDLYPTTLASLGVTIEGNKLGLGTNLFSDEKTLIEEYGFDYVDSELSAGSSFYINKIIYNSEK